MKNLKYIKSFFFDRAQYLIDDELGHKGVLIIDYKNNVYEIKVTGDNADDLVSEASDVAEDLLSRKHDVNFASK